jgi:phosphoribosylanthranilate isomerase
MTDVKICGITRVDDGLAALQAGADYLGFVFYRPSPRYLEPRAAAEIAQTCREKGSRRSLWRSVGVFVDEPRAVVEDVCQVADLDLVQVCGSEDRAYCVSLTRPVWRVLHVDPEAVGPIDTDPRAYGAERLLLDTKVEGQYGGTGRRSKWPLLRGVAARCILAGGLDPGNVGQAIQEARPLGVDVSSGVERDGVKDRKLIRAFVREVRRADRRNG